LRGPAVIDYTEPKLKFSAKHFPGAVESMMCAVKKGWGGGGGGGKGFFLTTLWVVNFF